MSRKKKYSLPIWLYNPNVENSENSNFIRLSHSQLTHKSFLKLSKTAKLIYIYMVNYSKGKREFSFPHRIYKNLVTKPTFTNVIDELNKFGFVEKTESGKFTRTESKYKFLTDWYK